VEEYFGFRDHLVSPVYFTRCRGKSTHPKSLEGHPLESNQGSKAIGNTSKYPATKNKVSQDPLEQEKFFIAGSFP